MPDWNSDREGHVEHKWVVQKAFAGDDIGDAIQTSKGELKPNDQGRMIIKDPALAHEIRMQNPRELTVSRMRYQKPADAGHRYHFGGWPEMPWKKKAQPQEGQKPQAEEPAEDKKQEGE